MQQQPLPITLVVASVDGGGLFHDAIVVGIYCPAYAVLCHVLLFHRACIIHLALTWPCMGQTLAKELWQHPDPQRCCCWNLWH